MVFLKKALLAASVVFFVACAHAPLPIPEDGTLLVTDRLSNQRVNAIAEDNDGYIWMGTFRGLNRYTPPRDFHQYFCTDDMLGLPDNQINHILSRRNGDLWAATVNGAAVRKRGGVFHRVGLGADNRNISQLMETRSGTLLATNGVSLFRYDEASDSLQVVLPSLNIFHTPGILLDAEDRLWVVTDNGFTINIFDTGDYSLVTSIHPPLMVYHLCPMGSDEIWLAGMGRLGRINAHTFEIMPLPEAIRNRKELMQGDIDILYGVDRNSLLLNVIGKGMFYYYRTREEVIFQNEPGFPFTLPNAEIRTIFRDSRHNLWFGTTDQGYSVSYFYSNEFNSNKFLTSFFQRKSVTALCPDPDGNLWISTQRDGLFLYDRKQGSILPVDVSSLINDNQVGYIRCNKVFFDADGDCWLLFPEKFRVIRCRWNGKELRLLDSIFAFTPLSIAQDTQGRIWIGGLGQQLQVYDKKTRTVKQVEAYSDWTFITDLLPTKPGRMLVAGFNQPLAVMDTYTDKAELIELSEEEKAACVKRSVLISNSIYQDSAGDLWIGTVANGLLKADAKKGKTAPVEGLPCQDVTAIQEDRQGNIWVSTMNGLGKYDRTVDRFVNYFEADGIGGNQFNDRASCILPDGTLVFGGTHGVTWFNPLDVSEKRTVPLVFQDLRIHNQLVQPSENGPIDRDLSEKPKVIISNENNGFSISFAALDYSELERIRYSYKLEGFDRYWVEAGTSHEAYYANLPAGKYRFRVRIDNNSRSIVETESSLNIQVLPPWYHSWWAILLWIALGAVIVGIGYTFWRHIRRVRKEAARRIREVRRERERAEEAEAAEKKLNKIQMNYFANVAHEFRTPLTMIAGPASQLSASEDIKGQDRQLVGVIQRNATWMLSLVNQLLDFNRIGNKKLQMKVSLMDIVDPLRNTAEMFKANAESKGIDFVTFGLEEPFTMWVDADKAQKIVMNLLSNALKFTPQGGKVSLSFDVIPRSEAAARFPLTEADTDGQYACISVADTGPGIPEDQLEKIFERFFQASSRQETQGSGIGLFYARALCGFHHGYIKAWNREEGGALFSVVLPVSASSYTEEERTTERPQLQVLPASPSPAGEEKAEEGSCKHIAVVDDDIDIANYLKILLSPSYKVSVYFDGTSALKGMEEDVPDLVISDVVMPGMNGYELCEAIKGNLQLSHIPVVLVTAKVAV